jgi:hypothetical protein
MIIGGFLTRDLFSVFQAKIPDLFNKNQCQMIKNVFHRALPVVIGACVAGLLTSLALAQTPQLGKSSVKTVIAAMTLEEKVKLVVGTGGDFPDLTGDTKAEVAPAMSAVDLVPGAAGTSYVVPRLGITPMVLTDGPAGLRIMPIRPNDPKTYYCTAFPVATLLASSWDTELVNKVGSASFLLARQSKRSPHLEMPVTQPSVVEQEAGT